MWYIFTTGWRIEQVTSVCMEDSLNDHCNSLGKATMVRAARQLLSAITKVLLLADKVVIKQLIAAKYKVFLIFIYTYTIGCTSVRPSVCKQFGGPRTPRRGERRPFKGFWRPFGWFWRAEERTMTVSPWNVRTLGVSVISSRPDCTGCSGTEQIWNRHCSIERNASRWLWSAWRERCRLHVLLARQQNFASQALDLQ